MENSKNLSRDLAVAMRDGRIGVCSTVSPGKGLARALAVAMRDDRLTKRNPVKEHRIWVTTKC